MSSNGARDVGATGARRGEVLALRWSDIQQGREVLLTRSLTQTRQVLKFKGTKTERPRRVELPASVLAPLEAHRQQQQKIPPAVRSRLPRLS